MVQRLLAVRTTKDGISAQHLQLALEIGSYHTAWAMLHRLRSAPVVEVREPKGIGRCRMAVLADAFASAFGPFVSANAEPGTRVITDGSRGSSGLAADRGEDPGKRGRRCGHQRGLVTRMARLP